MPSLWLLIHSFPPGLWHSPWLISPTQKTNKQEGADKAQLKLGYPTHTCTLDNPRGGLRGLGGTAYQDSCPSVSSRRAGNQKGRGRELNQKINLGTKPWRLWVGVRREMPESGPTSGLAQGPAQMFRKHKLVSHMYTLCAIQCSWSEINSHPLLVLT